ncbi:MAG: S8 family serine peptidase, partial [Anaerolineae bacterium]|nr:S8 family serine peptidase [Anaerolineae bacterium]
MPAREAGAVQIRLQQATFDPLQTSPQLLSNLSQAAYAGDGMGYYLVQFEGPILSEWKETLIKEGVALHDYVPDFAFIVKMDQATANRVQSLEMVRWVGLYQPAYRLSNALLPTVQSPAAGQPIQLVVRSFTGESAATLVKDFVGLGALVLTQSRDTGGGTIFQLELPETEVANVARLSGVAWVQPKYTPILYNAIARSSVAMNKDAVENTLGLYGENQIVVVGDTGFSTGNTATMHQDFQGHFYKGSWGSGTCASWADYHSHGTHVAGSVLGSGVMDGAVTTTHSYAGTNAGIAPEALLWGWAFCSDWTGLPDAPYDDYYGVMYNDDPRVRVNTNSWGSSAPYGTYDAFSRETDRFIWDHPDMVVLVAAGNDGTDANSDGIVDVDSMGIPAGSKNIITVGASENYRMSGGYNPGGACSTWGGCWPGDYPAAPVSTDRLSDDPSGMVAFSSRGPVDDGRLKPDVVAPGSNIVSARDDSGTGWGVYDADYIYMGGTSMATPLTAGAAAIVREFYSDTYSLNPTAALVKATFINGAFDMTPGQYRDTVPDGSKDDVIRRADINQGWGRVDLATSLIYAGSRQLWFHEHAGLATNSEYSVTLQTRYTENPFRVSLVWSDQAGTEATHGALVNDLDLVVESSTGSTYYGNDIIGDGLLDGDVDHTNNVEGIDLAAGIATYTITVKGYNVPNGPQPFALVVSGDMESVGVLEGVVSDAGTSVGIANARLAAAIVPTGTLNFATTAGNGDYRVSLVAGTYTVTASAYGYAPHTFTGVSIADGVTTTRDFALSPAPSYILTGTVTDASTGWALYASVEIA